MVIKSSLMMICFLIMSAELGGSEKVGKEGLTFSLLLSPTVLYTNSSATFNTFFLSKLSIGTPGQPFSLLVDTGSSQPWVYAAACRSAQACAIPNRYDPARSSSATLTAALFSASYGAGLVQGTVVVDDWQALALSSSSSSSSSSSYAVAGVSEGLLSLPSLSFGAVSSAFWSSSALASPQFSGFLGLTIPSNRSVSAVSATRFDGPSLSVTPVLQVLLDRQDLAANMFAFAPNVLTLGGYDPAYEPDLNWVPVAPHASARLPAFYWWIVALDALLVNGQPYGPCGQPGCQIMLDSGAGPLFLGPSLPGLALPPRYPCNQAAQLLPNITFVIGGRPYLFEGPDYSLPVNGTCWNQINQAAAMPQQQKATDAPVLLQFGAPWFQKYYTVHDFDNLMIGISPLSNESQQNS